MQHLPQEEGPSLADVARRAATVAAGRPPPVAGLRRGGRAPAVVAPPDALAQRVLPRAVLNEAVRYLVQGDAIAIEVLAAHLASWGYQRVALVEDRGEFSVRGGVVDVFPALEPLPLRLEME